MAKDNKKQKKRRGIFFGRDVNVGGDFVAGDKAVKGDQVGGDKVSGNKVSIGNVSGGSNVVVGDNATITVNETFQEIREGVRDLAERAGAPPQQQAQAEQAVNELQEMATSEEPPAPDRLDKILAVLEDVAPDAVELVINALTNPGAAVSGALRLALRAWRKARE